MKLLRTILFIAIAATLLSACAGQPLSTREKGTLAGGVLGAGTGAIIGAAVGSPGAGAAIGGGLGAVTGAIVGNEFQNQEVAQGQTRSEIASQQRQIDRQRSQIEQLQQQSETE
ncbi:MAG TPA: glycine zipper domain-containing protein [Candidatus Binataceae bacterium]|nr:glycine zipper domain-containing protein [Candidatus Binataceae bacterium]